MCWDRISWFKTILAKFLNKNPVISNHAIEVENYSFSNFILWKSLLQNISEILFLQWAYIFTTMTSV